MDDMQAESFGGAGEKYDTDETIDLGIMSEGPKWCESLTRLSECVVNVRKKCENQCRKICMAEITSNPDSCSSSRKSTKKLCPNECEPAAKRITGAKESVVPVISAAEGITKAKENTVPVVAAVKLCMGTPIELKNCVGDENIKTKRKCWAECNELQEEADKENYISANKRKKGIKQLRKDIYKPSM